MKTRRSFAQSRRGFTMIELMVAITILLILAALTFAVFKTNTGEKMRSGARIAQSALMGAKDRALHAKDLRGVRLVRDTTDQTLVTGFVYLKSLGTRTYAPGSIQLERRSLDPMQPKSAIKPDIIIVRGLTGTVEWDAISNFFANPGRIRIPSGIGSWYGFDPGSQSPYVLSSSNEVLVLQTPFVGSGTENPSPSVIAFGQGSTYSSCDIQLGNDTLSFHQPIALPSAIVIDLKFCSLNVQQASQSLAVPQPVPLPNMDLMFSPRGAVAGINAALGPTHFLLRTLDDATATVNFVDGNGNKTAGWYVGTAALPDPNKGDRMIVSLFPQTGLVQTFEFDATDVKNNQTGALVPDGLADNPFNFAQLGKTAGR